MRAGHLIALLALAGLAGALLLVAGTLDSRENAAGANRPAAVPASAAAGLEADLEAGGAVESGAELPTLETRRAVDQRGASAQRPAPIALDERVVSGLVVDALTGEPVPDYDFVLSGPGRARDEYLRTDQAGRFESATAFPVGAWLRGSWDRGSAHFLGDPLTLRVDLGPTFRLKVDAPAGIDREALRATLFASEPLGDEGEAVAITGLRGEGAAAWVRFIWSAKIDERLGTPVWLELGTPDGLHGGGIAVALSPGIHPGILPICVEPRAALLGSARDDGGFPVEGARVRLDGGPRGDEAPHLGATERLGSFSLGRLRPGAYTLSVLSPLHAPLEQQVLLEGGRAHELELLLERLPSGGDVSGTLRSATGRHHPEAVVILDALQPPHGSFEAEVEWSAEVDGWVGRFAFADLPSGEYAPQLLTDDRLDWEGTLEPVSPPRADLWFACDDGVAMAALALAAVDARTGHAAGDFEGWWTASMDEELFAGATGDAVTLTEGWPIGRALDFFVWAQDHGVARGDETAFGPPDENGVSLAEARLPPGWGAVLVAWDGNDHPLAGARAILDGRSAGATDELGVLVVNAPGPPQTFAFEHDERVWVGGTLAPGAIEFPAEERLVELFFERR